MQVYEDPTGQAALRGVPGDAGTGEHGAAGEVSEAVSSRKLPPLLWKNTIMIFGGILTMKRILACIAGVWLWLNGLAAMLYVVIMGYSQVMNWFHGGTRGNSLAVLIAGATTFCIGFVLMRFGGGILTKKG